jgi:hypothetical protein
MNILAALEDMAGNADLAFSSISPADIARWQNLFGFDASEAKHHIETYRDDVFHSKISDELWEMIASEKEAEGYDREAYEFSLSYTPTPTSPAAQQQQQQACPTKAETGTFLVHLDGVLDSAATIKEVAGMSETPALLKGVGEAGLSDFAQIDAAAKARLLSWLARHHAGFRPTIVRLTMAKKDLCRHSMAPQLGVDTTMPQHRLQDSVSAPPPAPASGQYPVWYFFYGTLADPAVLRQHLGLDEEPVFLPAYIQGGRIRTWGGKYRALVDAPGVEERMPGSAFLVENKEQEDALMFYEKEKYEVVRCRIGTEEGEMLGLTFRFDGLERELD